jgi:hypothetical protein
VTRRPQAARPDEGAVTKEVAIADRPPSVRRPGVRSKDQELIVAVDAHPGDRDRQVARAFRLGPELLGREPKRIDARKAGSRDAIGPEHRMGDDRPDLRPFAHRDLRRSRRERAAGLRNEAAHMDVELVLGSHNCGVHEKRDRVVLGDASARIFEERARAPRGVEITRRFGRLQERVLDSNDPSRRGQNRVAQQRRTHHDVADLLAAGKIDLKARKRRAGQLIVGDAGAHDLPQSHPMELHSIGRERRRRRQDDDHRKNP